MPQSKAFERETFGSWYEGRHHTGVMHDHDPTWLDDGLHDRDGSDSVRDTTTSITDHSRICKNLSDRKFLVAEQITILIASSKPRIRSQGTLGSAQEMTIPPSPDARVFGAISNMCGEPLWFKAKSLRTMSSLTMVLDLKVDGR